MNTIFIDIKNHNNKKNNIFYIAKDKILKMSITRDFTNDELSKNIFLELDKEFLDSILKNKCKFNEKILKLFFKKEYKNDTELFIVFSKEIDENKDYRKYIKTIINNTLGNNLNIYEIITQNDMLKHDTIYIDSILNVSNIKINKASVLIVINKVEDFNSKKVIEYIEKYRYVDILGLNTISKNERKMLLERINSINDEYGTTIEIIQRRNISEYDIYVFYSSIDMEMFKEHYILNKEARIIDTKNEEQDTLSLSFRTYKKNKYELEALFNRINCSINRFSKNKLGNLFIQKG